MADTEQTIKKEIEELESKVWDINKRIQIYNGGQLAPIDRLRLVTLTEWKRLQQLETEDSWATNPEMMGR